LYIQVVIFIYIFISTSLQVTFASPKFQAVCKKTHQVRVELQTYLGPTPETGEARSSDS
jgi:hypothetical protein